MRLLPFELQALVQSLSSPPVQCFMLSLSVYTHFFCSILVVRDFKLSLCGLAIVNFRYFIFLTCFPSYLKIFNYIVDGVFWLDIVIHFITGFRPPRSIETKYSFRMIAKKYFKGWFTIDFLAVFPLDAIMSAALGE